MTGIAEQIELVCLGGRIALKTVGDLGFKKVDSFNSI